MMKSGTCCRDFGIRRLSRRASRQASR
ncbi:hypothetical protein RHECNPAF_13300107 [Rhizobium etli CNPAF512]|nr:hypothetical protein RHECNPAF_13300107 [Rhizobium etli CNPAF512]